MPTYNVGPTDASPSLVDGDVVIFGAGEHTVTRSFDTTGFTTGIDFQIHPQAKIHQFEEMSGWINHATNIWKITGWSRSPINTGGQTRTGYLANKSIDLLTQSDSTSDTFNWFVHIDATVPGDLTADGEWWLDEDAGGAGIHDVYMYSSGGDPDTAFDRVVISGSTAKFVYGTGDNITIRAQPNTGLNLYNVRPQIRGYAPNAQNGVIDCRVGGDGWEIRDVDVIYNHGMGLYMGGSDAYVHSCRFNYNGQMGVGGAGTDTTPAENNVFEDCTWNNNNQAQFSHGWEAGGSKFVRQVNHVVHWCQANNNDGPGFWWDIDNYNVFANRNEAIDNQAVGIFYEISSHGYFYHNWLVDNGRDTGASFAWGGQILIASSPDCEAAFNHLAVSTTEGSGKPDCFGITQQSRGNFSINDGSTLNGQPRLALRTRIHHNTMLLGVDSTDQFLIGLHADFEDAQFNTASNWRVDYNTYWKITAETNTIYQWDSTAAANNLSEWQTESGFDANATENNEASTATFPAGWDSAPGWFDLYGANRKSLGYEERIQEFPVLIRAYTMDDASGSITDDSLYGIDVTNNGADYGATGIGDGNDALAFVSANSDRINAWSAGLEAGDWNGDQYTITLWVKPAAGSWTNSTQQAFFRMGSSGTTGQILATYRQDSTNNLLEWIIRHNGEDHQGNSAYSFTDWRPFIWRLDYVGQSNQFYLNTDLLVNDTTITEIGWATDPDITSDALFLGATNDSVEYMDGSLAYFYIYNGALPDYLLDLLRQYNDWPQVTNPGNQSDPEDSAISTLSITATDVNTADTLTYNAYGLPTGLSINSSTGDITGTPTTQGTYPVEIAVVDDGSPNRTSSVYFDWEITAAAGNTPPSWTTITDKEYGENETGISFGVTVTDPDDTVAITDVSTPTTLSQIGLTLIDNANNTGTISGNITGSPGVYTITLRADDGVNTPVDEQFDITINDEGVWSNPGTQNYTQGVAITPLVITFTDTDDTATLSASGLPTGLSDADNGNNTLTISGTPSAVPNTYEVTLSADDGVNPTVQDAFDIVIKTIPVLTNPGAQTDAEGDVISLQLTATDADGDTPLIFTLQSGAFPNGLSMDSSGLISGTIAYDANASSPFNPTVRVTDPDDNFDEESWSWTVNDTNRLDTIANQTDNATSTIDPIQPTLNNQSGTPAWSISGQPLNITINTSNGLITGTIADGQEAGSPYTVTVQVTDDLGTEQRQFTWTVTANQAPTLTDPGPYVWDELDVISEQLSASDPDGDTPLSFTVQSGTFPDGVSMSSSGLISGTLSATSSGSYTPTVRVTDPGGLFDDQLLDITVNDATNTQPNVAPINDQTNGEGDVISLNTYATDPEGNTISYSATNLPGGLTINSTTGLISGTIAYNAAFSSPYTVTITATDNGVGALQNSTTFIWEVLEVSRLVAIADRTDIDNAAITPFTPTLNSVNGTPAWSISGEPSGITINSSSGQISGTIASGAQNNSPYYVTVTVTDDTGTEQDEFIWYVVDSVPVMDTTQENNTLAELRSLPNVTAAANNLGLTRHDILAQAAYSTDFNGRYQAALAEGIEYVESVALTRALENKADSSVLTFLLQGLNPTKYG